MYTLHDVYMVYLIGFFMGLPLLGFVFVPSQNFPPCVCPLLSEPLEYILLYIKQLCGVLPQHA